MEYMWDWYYTSPIELTTSPPNFKNVPPSFSDNNTDEDYLPTVLLSNAARRLQNMWVLWVKDNAWAGVIFFFWGGGGQKCSGA